MSAFFQRKPRLVSALDQLLQAKAPVIDGAELAALYYSQRQGGDFHDFLRVSPSRVVFGLLDVAGRVDQIRGVISAAQQVFRCLSSELFAVDEVNEAEAMIQIAVQLNHSILGTESTVHACPAFAGCYNEAVGTICYFNAGHTPGLLRDGDGVTELPATGLPLGLFSHATHDAPTVALPSDAALLLISRGVVEGKCNNEEFGLERAKRSFLATPGRSAQEVCAAILDKVQQFMCVQPTHDDVSALALVRAAAAKVATAGPSSAQG
jgi:serine phosphatase RsbU (regulator of sigma subunit)